MSVATKKEWTHEDMRPCWKEPDAPEGNETMELDTNRTPEQSDGSNRDFAFAIRMVRAGQRAYRESWPIYGKWIELFTFGGDYSGRFSIHGTTGRKVRPCIALRTADGDMQPGWTPTQEDMLADDWEMLPADEDD